MQETNERVIKNLCKLFLIYTRNLNFFTYFILLLVVVKQFIQTVCIKNLYLYQDNQKLN